MSGLLEEVQPNRSEPKEPESTGPLSKVVGALVGDIHTDLVITKYSNTTFVCVTQLSKFGTLLQVEREQVRSGQDKGKLVYSSTVLLGQDSEELQLLARILAEKSQLSHPIILSVGVKGLTIDLALKLVEFILQNL